MNGLHHRSEMASLKTYHKKKILYIMEANVITYLEVNLKYTRFCGEKCFRRIMYIRDHLNKYLLFLCMFIDRKQNMQKLSSP